ncbi:Uncharacterised protein [Vibrio cholerae]|nr:Uncharacterised protein [Vibrio cholerae]CSD35763.1 Uncharacterised protein [Vibrio cholerae]CSD68313.1 Uncharacterised protein [Vibrio cholerae]
MLGNRQGIVAGNQFTQPELLAQVGVVVAAKVGFRQAENMAQLFGQFLGVKNT